VSPIVSRTSATRISFTLSSLKVKYAAADTKSPVTRRDRRSRVARALCRSVLSKASVRVRLQRTGLRQATPIAVGVRGQSERGAEASTVDEEEDELLLVGKHERRAEPTKPPSSTVRALLSVVC